MDILLAAALSCADGRWILSGIADTTLGISEQTQLITEVMREMPNDCSGSDYNPPPREERFRH